MAVFRKGPEMLKKLLTTPTTQLGRAGRFWVFQVKLWTHCIRLLRSNRAGQQAAALSYNTIFGLIPLTIVMLLILQLSPKYSEIGEKIKTFFYEQTHLSDFKTVISSDAGAKEGETEGTKGVETESVSLTEHLNALVGKFLAGTNKGSIGVFSVLLVIWAALGLLTTVEKAFNNIWHTGRGRSFLHRIIIYWAVLTLGPLVMSAGIYGGISLGLSQIQVSVFSQVAPMAVSFLVAAVVLFLLYLLLPNTKVQARYAIWGALVGAVVWLAAKNMYGYCVTNLHLYSTLYGLLSLIPITVMWIYITWLIVLFGLQVTYTTQHLTTLDEAEMAASRKTEGYFMANDVTAINILREAAAAFQGRQGPVSCEAVCSKLEIPAEFGEKILGHLVERGLLVKVSEPRVGFMPAREPEQIRLSEISEAMSAASFGQSSGIEGRGIEEVLQNRRSCLEKYNLKEMLEAPGASAEG